MHGKSFITGGYMQFLGTAAADVLPGPLCSCPICEDARKKPERGRLRCLFLLDAENMIDCGPDFAAAVMRHGTDVTQLRNIFLTHTHEDHFCGANAGLLRMSRTRSDIPIDLYLSEMAHASLMKKAEFYAAEFPGEESIRALQEGSVRLHPVKAGVPFYAGGYEVLPVNTTHKASPTETAYNYRFRKDGHSLLYACDTGYYTTESLDFLEDSRLDILIMEGTWGNLTDKSTTSHLNAYAFVEQLNIFREHRIIRDDTQIFCTHINHKHDLNHEAYQEWFDAHTDLNVKVAYDGLKIDFRSAIKD